MAGDAASRVEEITAVMVAAFAEDPFMHWLLTERFAESHIAWWRWVVANPSPGAEKPGAEKPGAEKPGAEKPGAEQVVNSAGTAAALWYRPVPSHRESAVGAGGDFEHVPLAQSGFAQMVAALVGDRTGEVMDMLERLSAAHPTTPHWYLSAVGTIPAEQGRGVGAALLRPVLDRCDHDAVGAYLESSNPRNICFYERLGFETTGEIISADGRARLTPMWRDPRPPGR